MCVGRNLRSLFRQLLGPFLLDARIRDGGRRMNGKPYETYADICGFLLGLADSMSTDTSTSGSLRRTALI